MYTVSSELTKVFTSFPFTCSSLSLLSLPHSAEVGGGLELRKDVRSAHVESISVELYFQVPFCIFHLLFPVTFLILILSQSCEVNILCAYIY